jgi:hypothetical protein
VIFGRISWFMAACAVLPLLLGKSANAEWITFSTPPEALAVFGANPDTVVTQTSTNQVHCFYNVSGGGWSGAGFNWDNFSTPESEYIDLSSSTGIVMGISGTCTNLKLELEDIYTNKAQYYLTGIASSVTKTWTIPADSLTQYFPHFDRSRVRFFFFVATPGNSIGNVGAGNEIGNFTIYCNGGLPFKYYVGPSTSGTLTRLPGNPRVMRVGGGNVDTLIRQTEDSTFAVDYNVTTGGWAGASISFSRITSADFSATPELVFSVSGTPMSVKFEIEDTSHNRLNAYLYNVNGGIRYYAVDTAIVAGQGIDVSHIAFMNFVVDNPLAGPAAQGTFRIWSLGPALDTDDDGMPDHVELANGLDPDNKYNGSGADEDPDGDGVGNYNEIIAGTAPLNSNSVPVLHMGSIGSSITLSFDGIAGRKYRFYVCDNLKTGVWTQVGSTEQPSANAPLERVVAPPPPDSSRFYRVRITKD